MACGCKKSTAAQYVWTKTNSDGSVDTVIYPTEIQAKAKVIRSGGSYTTKG